MTNIVSAVSKTSAWLAVVTSLLGVTVESKPAAAKTSDTLDLRMPDVQPQAVSQSAPHVTLGVVTRCPWSQQSPRNIRVLHVFTLILVWVRGKKCNVYKGIFFKLQLGNCGCAHGIGEVLVYCNVERIFFPILWFSVAWMRLYLP